MGEMITLLRGGATFGCGCVFRPLVLNVPPKSLKEAFCYLDTDSESVMGRDENRNGVLMLTCRRCCGETLTANPHCDFNGQQENAKVFSEGKLHFCAIVRGNLEQQADRGNRLCMCVCLPSFVRQRLTQGLLPPLPLLSDPSLAAVQ